MDLNRKQTKNKEYLKKLANAKIKLLKESFGKISIQLRIWSSRWAEGERSKDFSLEKFIEYLNNQLPYMPPIEKPNALIESLAPRNPLPSL